MLSIHQAHPKPLVSTASRYPQAHPHSQHPSPLYTEEGVDETVDSEKVGCVKERKYKDLGVAPNPQASSEILCS